MILLLLLLNAFWSPNFESRPEKKRNPNEINQNKIAYDIRYLKKNAVKLPHEIQEGLADYRVRIAYSEHYNEVYVLLEAKHGRNHYEIAATLSVEKNIEREYALVLSLDIGTLVELIDDCL